MSAKPRPNHLRNVPFWPKATFRRWTANAIGMVVAVYIAPLLDAPQYGAKALQLRFHDRHGRCVAVLTFRDVPPEQPLASRRIEARSFVALWRKLEADDDAELAFNCRSLAYRAALVELMDANSASMAAA